MPFVIPLLANDAVVRDAVRALRKIAPRSTGQLLDALLDSEVDVRVQVALALVQIHDEANITLPPNVVFEVAVHELTAGRASWGHTNELPTPPTSDSEGAETSKGTDAADELLRAAG